MPIHAGTCNSKSDHGMCMAVGCDRKALYRSPGPGKNKAKGYCREHKRFAVASSLVNSKRIEANHEAREMRLRCKGAA